MRLILITCLSIFLQATGFTIVADTNINDSHSGSKTEVVPLHNIPPSKVAVLALTVDTIHQINCLRATGYLRVLASGGATPYTYNWSNGNTGAVATSLPAGTYEITVTDNVGSTASVSATILEDLVPPGADAGSDFTAVCANSTVIIYGSGSVGPDFTYLWTASNGGLFKSGETTLTPTIKHVGTFTLKVTNTENGCTNTSSVVATATNQPPSVSATGGVFTCSLPTVTLNATYPSSNTTFVWNGPGNYISYALHPQVSTVGTYIFKATDTLTTCSNTANALVTADTSKPVAIPVGGLINCTQPSLSLTGTFLPVGVTFLWVGPAGFSSMLPNPVVSAAGDYRVTVTKPGNGCTASGLAVVTANFTPPTATATPGGSLTCVSNSVVIFGGGSPAGITFSWTGPAGFSSTLQNPTVNNPGTYVLTTKNPQNGCTAAASAAVLSNTAPPGVSAIGGTKTCSNPTVTLQATSSTQGVSFKWSGPSGFMSTLPNPTVSLTGTYGVTVTNPVNGCTSATSVSVTQNYAQPQVTATTATITCYVPAPKVKATSTTNGATFQWSGPNGFSSNNSNPSVTIAGYYAVTATNPANGCTSSASIYVSENITPPYVYAGEDRHLNCYFNTILANPIGTATGSTISYLWTTWDGIISSGATTLYARFDAIGNYTLTVTNSQNGCIGVDSMEVMQTPPLGLTFTQLTPVSCNGAANGSVKASPSGGTTSYAYIWSNGSQNATINNLSSGTYSVTVTDTEGCTIASSVSITQPAVLMANVSTTPQTIVGVNNGSATVIPGGGTAPYTVKWSTGSTFLAITSLAPGTYTVTVTDNKGCTKSNSANVNAISCTIGGEVSAIGVNCAGTATGSATANITGAPAPITYHWSNGAQTATAATLVVGNYTVTATGANGCTIVLSTQVTGPQPLSLSVVSNTGITCAGLQNGATTMNTTGGVAPYSYSWSNGNNGAAISNLAAGTYTCTTTDSKGCTAVQSTQVTGPAPVVLTIASKIDVACVDGQTGSITMNATGGTAPFNYSWSTTASGPTVNGLTVGNYQCTVTDANGCSKNLSAAIVATDNVPPQLILKSASAILNASGTATVTPSMFDNGSFDQTCNIASWTISPSSFNCTQIGAQTVTLTATDKNNNTATGTAIVTVVDNIAPVLTCPPNQSTSACTPTVFFAAPQIQDNCSIVGAPSLVSGLPSGSSFPTGVTQQQFTYTDAGANMGTCGFTVTVLSSLNITVATQPTSCNGNCDGTATLTVAGGANPSAVLWSNGQTGLTATSLCPGDYNATVTDGAGCTQTYTAQIHTEDTQAPILMCPDNIVAGYCNATIVFSQPQVLDNCAFIPQQLQLVSGLASGANFPTGLSTQLFRYTDGGGNEGECSFSVTVHPAPAITSNTNAASCAGMCNGTANITASGGQGPFGILWSNGAAGPSLGNLCAGQYTATITDGDGCQQMQIVQVMQPSAMAIATSTVNNDTGNTGTGSILISMEGGTFPYTYTWQRNGQYFANTQNIFSLFSGEYTLLVTDAQGCTFTSAAFTIGASVATSEAEGDYKWSIFPNPAQTEVFIKMEALGAGKTHLRIFDAAGRLLLEQSDLSANNSKIRIDISNLPDGLLLLRLSNDFGIFSKRLLKAAD